MNALPDYQEAVGHALKSVPPLDRFEDIGLESSCGRVLAQPVTADRDLPPFNRAQMDGYALRAAEYAARQQAEAAERARRDAEKEKK